MKLILWSLKTHSYFWINWVCWLFGRKWVLWGLQRGIYLRFGRQLRVLLGLCTFLCLGLFIYFLFKVCWERGKLRLFMCLQLERTLLAILGGWWHFLVPFVFPFYHDSKNRGWLLFSDHSFNFLSFLLNKVDPFFDYFLRIFHG